jgi:hypothetical protein
MDEHLKRIQSEVDQMNKTFDGEPESEPELENGPDESEPLGTESPSTESPTTEVPDEPSDDNEVDEKDKTIEDLRTKLAELESKSKSQEPSPTEAPTTEVPLQLEDQDFFSDFEDDFEDLTTDKEGFNKILNKIYKKAVTDTRKVLGEGVLRSIPDIVKSQIAVTTNLKRASDEFYENNKDLEPFKKVVASVFEEKASEHPEKDYKEILTLVAPEVRNRLELHKKATTKESSPRLPKNRGKPGKAPEKPKTSSLQAELDEMNKVLGGI